MASQAPISAGMRWKETWIKSGNSQTLFKLHMFTTGKTNCSNSVHVQHPFAKKHQQRRDTPLQTTPKHPPQKHPKAPTLGLLLPQTCCTSGTSSNCRHHLLPLVRPPVLAPMAPRPSPGPDRWARTEVLADGGLQRHGPHPAGRSRLWRAQLRRANRVGGRRRRGPAQTEERWRMFRALKALGGSIYDMFGIRCFSGLGGF